MHYALAFAEHWLGGLSDVLVSFAGILICILAVGAFWDRRIRTIDLTVMITCGCGLIFSPLIHTFVKPVFDIKQSVLVSSLAALALCAGTVILYLRRSDLPTQSHSFAASSIFTDDTYGRSTRGTIIGVPIIILLSVAAVLITGLSAPQVMIGDEVTHYYMLVQQGEDLSKPQLFAEIPTATGDTETRRYPHPFGWHYLGAVIHVLTGGSFVAIQLYQALFLTQLLIVAYLLARDRQGVESRSALVYVLLIASLPLTLIFSVAFYQDVPMTAQVLTAFYLLRRGKWFWASIFMALAISFKVTATLFYPSFFILLLYWQIIRTGWLKGLLATICACLLVLGVTWQIGRAIVAHGDTFFYPQMQLEKVIKKTKSAIESKFPVLSKNTGLVNLNTNLSSRPSAKVRKKEHKYPVIANHPGDLRVKQNFLVYGGLVMWLMVITGIGGSLFSRISGSYPLLKQRSSLWLYLVGGSYMVIAAWYIKTAPDARFFLPGLPFLLLPFVEKSVCLPKPKLFISLIAALAFLQGGYVLQKTYHLRALKPDIKAAINYLQDNPPSGYIFMYPEGNYRYFPVRHEWYLGYRLREFWRGDNDKRIELLREYNVSAIVIKKHLIAPVGQEITNLGVYPVYFVEDIAGDPRFVKTYENDAVIIYRVTFE